MFDRRSEPEIQREMADAKATRVGQLATAAQQIMDVLRAYTRLVEFLIVITIIVGAICVLWPRYLQARHSALVTTCLEKLNELGHAMEMYNTDYHAYPEASMWYKAVGDYLGPFEDARVKPFKCPADHTAAPTSYYYLDASLLPEEQSDWPLTEIPMLVDESYHADRATVLWYDGHQNALDKLDWLNLRINILHLRRTPGHPEAMCLLPVSPPEDDIMGGATPP